MKEDHVESARAKEKEPVRDAVVGDTVRLNSGGPDMTVTKVIKEALPLANVPGSVATEAALECAYFDGDAKLHVFSRGSFPPAAVTLVKQKDK